PGLQRAETDRARVRVRAGDEEAHSAATVSMRTTTIGRFSIALVVTAFAMSASAQDARRADGRRHVSRRAPHPEPDADRIVLAGDSADGHLALTTGMLTTSAGFDRSCQTTLEPKVAAIVDFYG